MKVLVTGGSGKIGAFVVDELIRESGHDVVVFDRTPPAKRNSAWIEGNVEQLGDVVSAMRGADAVIHLAGIPVPDVMPDAAMFRINTIGAFNVHEAAFLLGIQRVVSSSTAAVLGWAYQTRPITPKFLPIDESHPIAAQDAYSMSKLCLEQIAQAYAERCDMQTIVFRPPRVLVPATALEYRQKGGATAKRFDPYAYIDVRDLAAAYRKAAELPGLKHDCVYVAAADSCVGEPLSELMPRLMPSIGDMAAGLTGTRSALSNKRAKELLQWEPRFSWRTASEES